MDFSIKEEIIQGMGYTLPQDVSRYTNWKICKKKWQNITCWDKLIPLFMANILEEKGFRIYIYSNDHPPIHVHVRKGGSEAKVHLEPVLLVKDNDGFKSQELRQILTIIDQHFDFIKQRWHETFNQ